MQKASPSLEDYHATWNDSMCLNRSSIHLQAKQTSLSGRNFSSTSHSGLPAISSVLPVSLQRILTIAPSTGLHSLHTIPGASTYLQQEQPSVPANVSDSTQIENLSEEDQDLNVITTWLTHYEDALISQLTAVACCGYDRCMVMLITIDLTDENMLEAARNVRVSKPNVNMQNGYLMFKLFVDRDTDIHLWEQKNYRDMLEQHFQRRGKKCINIGS